MESVQSNPVQPASKPLTHSLTHSLTHPPTHSGEEHRLKGFESRMLRMFVPDKEAVTGGGWIKLYNGELL